jgi:hypothetical protein
VRDRLRLGNDDRAGRIRWDGRRLWSRLGNWFDRVGHPFIPLDGTDPRLEFVLHLLQVPAHRPELGLEAGYVLFRALHVLPVSVERSLAELLERLRALAVERRGPPTETEAFALRVSVGAQDLEEQDDPRPDNPEEADGPDPRGAELPTTRQDAEGPPVGDRPGDLRRVLTDAVAAGGAEPRVRR